MARPRDEALWDRVEAAVRAGRRNREIAEAEGIPVHSVRRVVSALRSHGRLPRTARPKGPAPARPRPPGQAVAAAPSPPPPVADGVWPDPAKVPDRLPPGAPAEQQIERVRLGLRRGESAFVIASALCVPLDVVGRLIRQVQLADERAASTEPDWRAPVLAKLRERLKLAEDAARRADEDVGVLVQAIAIIEEL